MKIAIIDPSLFTWPYDRRLARGLEAVGHEVKVIGKVLRHGDEGADDPLLRQHFYPRLARATDGPLPTRLIKLAKGLSHVASMVRLTRWLERWRPDVVHFQWLPLPLVDRLFIPRLRRIAPLVLTVHDSNPFNGEAGLALQRLGITSTLSMFDHIVVHNRKALERLRALGVAPGRLSAIAHGLLSDDLAVPVSPPGPAPANDEPLMLLQFGKIKAYKGVDVLIRAAALMPREVRDRCRIKVIGKPYVDPRPLFELARALDVEDTVELDLRFVSDEEMMLHFSRAAGVLLPYREIDTSGVLMVALAVGVPIVASAIGSFAEMLEDGRHGLLVPPGDERALADALCRLVTDDDLRASMRGEVAALRATVPSWRDIAATTAAVYTQIRAAAA